MKRDRNLWALGREIQRVRRERGLIQKELAELSGLNWNYIGGIERADRNVGISAIFRLARALNVHPADLLSAIP